MRDVAIPRTFRKTYGIATPLRPQARFERNRRRAAALSARCGALARNDVYIIYFINSSRSASIAMAISLLSTVAPLALA